MPKVKPSATIAVANGQGGMSPVVDARFDACDWPIELTVQADRADDWMLFFRAECASRGGSYQGLGQLEAHENSGSLTVSVLPGIEAFAIVWERVRNGPLQLRMRCLDVPRFSLADLQEFVDRVTCRSAANAREHFYRRWQLHYDGLPWKGELWLDDHLRLGPPSVQYELALIGPRVIIVDMLIAGIDAPHATGVFQKRLSHLGAFLSVVTGKLIDQPEQGHVWVLSEDLKESVVRYKGYLEPHNPKEMPQPGDRPTVPLISVIRPDFSTRGISFNDVEQSLPADVQKLWMLFKNLPRHQREQFLRAAAKWQEGLRCWGSRPTLSFALMVVACEALKPAEATSKNHNIYYVVKALLGKQLSTQLKNRLFDAQIHFGIHPNEIRNSHLHRGEFHSSEFLLPALMVADFRDPTFDAAHRVLAQTTQAAIIEWLKRPTAFHISPQSTPALPPSTE